MAREKGLDLIEIAPTVNPPICKIMDYGKFQYQRTRQERDQKSKQKKIETKGIRISIKTGKHDLEFKMKNAEKFLNKEHKVKIDMILKGREKTLESLAREKLNEFVQMIPLEIIVEQEIRRQPRGLSMVIVKGKQNA